MLIPRHMTVDSAGAPALLLTVECKCCGEFIRTRVDKANDLQDVYAQDDRPCGYVLTKEIVGARCRNIVHITIQFDEHRRPRDIQVEGGHLVHLECTD